MSSLICQQGLQRPRLTAQPCLRQSRHKQNRPQRQRPLHRQAQLLQLPQPKTSASKLQQGLRRCRRRSSRAFSASRHKSYSRKGPKASQASLTERLRKSLKMRKMRSRMQACTRRMQRMRPLSKWMTPMQPKKIHPTRRSLAKMFKLTSIKLQQKMRRGKSARSQTSSIKSKKLSKRWTRCRTTRSTLR